MARPFAYPQGAEPVSLAALIQAEAPKPKPTKLDRIFEALSDDDKATLAASLKDPGVFPGTIARALTKAGHPIGEKAIREARADIA